MFKGAIAVAIALSLIGAGGTIAARNGGGAMLLHANDAAVYSSGWDYCADNALSPPLPATCGELVTQTNHDPTNDVAMIWMVAAFPDAASPAVTAYQVGIYGDIPGDYYSAWGFCPTSALEVPDATWPAPGTGTAAGFTAGAITDHLWKMYWFGASAPATGSIMRTGAYPHGTDGAGWADDGAPPLFDVCLNFGGVGWGVQGEKSCPTTVDGACCLQGWYKCIVTSDTDCQAQGGIFLGVGSVCDAANRCSACCYEAPDVQLRFCSMVPEWYCLDRYSEGGSGGLYRNPSWSGLKQDGTGNLCAPSADSLSFEWWCDVVGTRTQQTSWGKLKSLFR